MGMTPKSSLLLGISCIAFVAAVGCIFELSSGEPNLGQWVTAAILAFSTPLGVFTFIAATRDAKANQ
jgi:hypothetical protein